MLRSGLLNRDELQGCLKGVASEQRADPVALADHLVRMGKLTRFQAGKLLRGISRGMLIGHFRVLAPLGKGGMGTVFLIRDDRNQQLAALKILPLRLARTQQHMLDRFHREKELSRRVAHQHLAWTYEVGEFRGVHYIAMEYIPGRTLSRLHSGCVGARRDSQQAAPSRGLRHPPRADFERAARARGSANMRFTCCSSTAESCSFPGFANSSN